MEKVTETAERLTQILYRMATSQTLTLEQALEHLKRDACARPLRETLAKYAGKPAGKELSSFLTARLLEHSPEGTPQDTVEHKVRLWMKEDARGIRKSSAIQLSFALGLPAEEANTFLQRTCGEGFHLRTPEEIVFLYALKNGMNYREALALRADMEEKGLLEVGKDAGDGLRTEVVGKRMETLRGARELEELLREYQGRLGTLHNTAYQTFRSYLALLTNPQVPVGMDPERKLSVREVTDVYLHEKLIPRVRGAAGKRGGDGDLLLSALRRDIQQSWPDETALSKMLNRKADVSRKALILLFLATDGGEEAETGEEETPEVVFEDAYSRIHAMLVTCGFAPLDARSAFDWMVLYCMCVEADDTLYIDERVRKFLREIFPAQEEGA